MILVVSAVSMAPPTNGDYVFPYWSQMVGWTLTFASIVPIPVVAGYKFLITNGSFTQVSEIS